MLMTLFELLQTFQNQISGKYSIHYIVVVVVVAAAAAAVAVVVK